MTCTAATFKSKDEATTVKRHIFRSRAIKTELKFCEQCDCYHLVNAEILQQCRWKKEFYDKREQIMELVAQGFQDREIAAILECKERSVEYIVEKMVKDYGALSRAHCVAILIAFGVIHPNRFVPGIAEHV